MLCEMLIVISASVIFNAMFLLSVEEVDYNSSFKSLFDCLVSWTKYVITSMPLQKNLYKIWSGCLRLMSVGHIFFVTFRSCYYD